MQNEKGNEGKKVCFDGGGGRGGGGEVPTWRSATHFHPFRHNPAQMLIAGIESARTIPPGDARRRIVLRRGVLSAE